MSKKKRYSIIFYLSENTWSKSGIPCPDCVDESNYQAWSQYLSKQIDKLLCAETMQAAEFQEELEKIRRDREERIAHQKRLDEAAEVRRRRSCMARPKIDYIPKGLTVDLEEAYAEYFKQEVEFRPENKEDFLYMLRLLERWEKKSIPAVLAKGRPDAAYAIAMGLCEHLPLLIYREDIRDYLNDYKLRIGKLIYASFAALVDSVAAWNNEEKREEVFTYIFTHLLRFDGFKRVQNNIQMLAPSKKFAGEPLKIEREMNDEEERAAREAERRRREKERQMLEAEKEAKSLIPLNKDYEQRIFNRRNVDWDCYSIWQLMLEENKIIETLLAVGEYQTTALMFLQLTKSMCRHFVMDRHSYKVFSAFYLTHKNLLSQLLFLAHKEKIEQSKLALVYAILELSNEIADRFCYGRNVCGKYDAESVYYSNYKEYSQRDSYNCFCKAELIAILSKYQIDVKCLRPLILCMRRKEYEKELYQLGHSDIFELHPFIEFDNGDYLVLFPANLLRLAYRLCYGIMAKDLGEKRLLSLIEQEMIQETGFILQNGHGSFIEQKKHIMTPHFFGSVLTKTKLLM